MEPTSTHALALSAMRYNQQILGESDVGIPASPDQALNPGNISWLAKSNPVNDGQ